MNIYIWWHYRDVMVNYPHPVPDFIKSEFAAVADAITVGRVPGRQAGIEEAFGDLWDRLIVMNKELPSTMEMVLTRLLVWILVVLLYYK